jgi:hypothetical protein
MTKKELQVKAQRLVQPPPEVVKEYSEKRELLAAEMNRIMLGRSDLDTLIGENNREMMEQNHRNHALFMESLFMSYQPVVLVETVLWVFRAYRSHGFNLTYWPAQLDTWLSILKKELSSASFGAIQPFYHWMIINQPVFAELSNPMPGDHDPAPFY